MTEMTRRGLLEALFGGSIAGAVKPEGETEGSLVATGTVVFENCTFNGRYDIKAKKAIIRGSDD